MLTQVHHQAATASSRRSLAARLLTLLLAADARFRDMEHLRQMSSERLDDIGVTRSDLDRAIGSPAALPHDPRFGW